MLLTILGLLCGAVLSLRFDVLILVPAILLGCALAVVGGLATGTSIVLGVVLVASALQVGYILGVVGQWALRSQRALPESWPEKTTVAPDSAF